MHEHMRCCQELVTSPTLNLHVAAPDWSNSNRVFSVRYELNYVLACCSLHQYSVLVEVKAFGSIGEHPYTVTTIVCGDCCNYQVSLEKGRQNMVFLKKLKFWKKRNNKTPTKVDACVSTKDLQTCDASAVTMDPTKVDACASTQDPRTCNASTVSMDLTKMDANVSTEDPQTCDASTVTMGLTKVDACVSTEDPRTCNASTMTMDPTVMCNNYKQTETRMDSGGAAAAKEEYERELEIKNQKIREVEEELAVSKRLAADLMLNMNSVKQQVQKYVEEPFIL